MYFWGFFIDSVILFWLYRYHYNYDKYLLLLYQKIIDWDMNPQICNFFFLPCYFLSVGMAKCDITRGRDTCTGCIGENRASNVMILIQGMSIIIFHSSKTYATATIVIQRGNNGGQPTLTSYFCSSIIKEWKIMIWYLVLVLLLC